MSPNIYNVGYTHAAGNRQSAGRVANYISRRSDLSREEREAGVEPTRESEWREIETIGDRGQFVAEANRRREERRREAEERGAELSKDRSPGAAQYLHVVISPERGNEMADEDFHRLAREFIHDDAGREYPHLAAVHRDTDHDHVHVVVARDKFGREELRERKERSEELAREIERFREYERTAERGREPHRGAQRDPAGEREHAGERDPGRETGSEHGRDLER